MGTIVISQNITLDGVIEDPTGDDGFEQGGWFEPMSDADRRPWAALKEAEAMTADALLLGRRTDSWFGTRWNERDGAWADRLRALPKHVVSTTLAEPLWIGSSLLTGDMVKAVSEVRESYDGDIIVYGSGTLCHALLEHDLVDEVRLTVFPCVVGSGQQLFTGATRRLRPTRVEPLGESLTQLVYEVVRT